MTKTRSSGADQRPAATYDPATPAVLIRHLTVTDQAVCAEATRWSTGARSTTAAAGDLAGADLTAFVTQALAVGAQAIAGAGGVQDTYNLERLVTDVGRRTAASTSQAASATAQVVNDASEAMQKASTEARKAIAEAGESARTGFATSVEAAQASLREELIRLLGGDSPELITRLGPLMDKFGREVDERAARQTTELFDRAAKQLDPDDPTTPLAKHQRALARQQQTLAESIEKNHLALASKVEQLTSAVQVNAAAAAESAALSKVTPLKGVTYAHDVHAVMQDVAAGLGDEYTDTGALTGAVARSKKGDGLLTVEGGPARVVLEMTDSARTGWNAYLDEAERNREAAASLGLVRQTAQNAGHSIRALTGRRIVMAFDPQTDDPSLLRTVVQLLRVAAVAASARQDSGGIRTANERIDEALAVISTIDGIRKAAGSIRKGADTIETQGADLQTTLARLLTQARTALAGAEPLSADALAAAGSRDDAA
jgi:hypothetical protein